MFTTDKELIINLGRKCTEEEQKQIIEEILRRKDFNISLIVYEYGSKISEIVANILSRLKHENRLPLSDGLFEWLLDINWPGADTIQQLLAEYSKVEFMPYYERAVQKAIDHKEPDWLGYLSYFIRPDTTNIQRSDFVDQNLYDQLYACKNNFWL